MNELVENAATEVFLGNTLAQWAGAALTAFLVVLGLILLKKVALRRLAREADPGRHLAVTRVVSRMVDATSWIFIFVVALYAGSRLLVLPANSGTLLRGAVVVVAFVQLALWASRALTVWLEHQVAARRQLDAAGATTVSILGLVARVAIWAIVFLLIVDNLGFDVTALMAGLGIGGIAVALAVQNVLGDIFASVSIALDKPFVIGDFIIVGDMVGTVEYIGIKTTRLRSLSGEQLVISNADLLSTRIRNYKRMFERRIVQSVGVEYGTPTETVERIPGMIREAVEAQEGTRFDRAHFSAFGDSALLFEFVYFVLSPDYNKYMDIQQNINRQLLREFRARDISFAFPTRTVHLQPAEPAEAPA